MNEKLLNPSLIFLSSSSLHPSLRPREFLQAKTIFKGIDIDRENSRSNCSKSNQITQYSHSKTSFYPLDLSINNNNISALADFLLSRWTNGAETPDCMHLSSKPSNKTRKIQEVLQKAQFNITVRFVFSVGLEGMGHHFLGPMFKSSKSSECLPAPVKEDEYASTLAYDQMTKGLFGSSSNFTFQRERLIKYMEMLVNVANKFSTKQKRSVVINTMCPMHVGMLSYPNDHIWNRCHRTDFIDIRVLAEIFEALGLDLRIVVMYRNALDILLSTSIRRKFGLWDELEDIYQHTTEKFIIQQQLLRIDPKFFKCFDYDRLPELPNNFGEFFNLAGPNGEEFRVHNFEESVEEVERVSLRETYVKIDEKERYKELQTIINKLKHICSNTGTTYS
eukprot:snap_masked-scaffold_31-processed-gene-0.28-mRNA-1 protein AED:1.00 eAED:1.00 QI:0/0/0/0/1/1/2/0/390